jgi:multidrug efflux pump subunit AcrA (membrane-fusion protein)
VTTFPVLSRIDNGDGLLLPGMNADVDIIIHRRPQVLTVPNEAVREPADAMVVADLLGLQLDRQQIEGGRVAMTQAARPSRGDQPGLAGRRSGGSGRGAFGGGRGGNDDDDEAGGQGPQRSSQEAFGLGSEPDRAVVFLLVEGPEGVSYDARPVMVGVRDWERSEIVAGLNPGERVVLLPSTSLLQSQDELRERFSRRSMIPGLRR